MSNPVEIAPMTVAIFYSRNDKMAFVWGSEVLMRTSKYFRNLVKPPRAIEGDCPICREALEKDVGEGAEELTYCESSCGNNFHKVCLDEWKRSHPPEALIQCPTCRQDWGAYNFPDTSQKAFDVYYAWLYSANVELHKGYIGPVDVNPTFIEMFEAYQLGVALSEPEFCLAVKQNIEMKWTEDAVFPNRQDVTTAYSITPVKSPLR
jgi:hypothetical protein